MCKHSTFFFKQQIASDKNCCRICRKNEQCAIVSLKYNSSLKKSYRLSGISHKAKEFIDKFSI